SNLIRTWYAARTGNRYQEALLVIALPSDTTNRESSAHQIKNELIIRGINEDRIRFEPEGTNTRSQALRLVELTGGHVPVAVVTSPEHMKRSILTLGKAGFSQLWGIPAFENPNDAPLEFEDESLGGKQKGVPKIGRNLGLRYHFWTQLHYERLVVREYLALAYYKMKGWI
ncbi:MAG: YdcF family protein, partial [Bacteroidales bacterium]